ncbi:MAG: ABC transporter ATP-binding protein [Acidimicrobiia bacterium]
MTLLDAQGITKRFAGITALNDVSLTVDAGEMVGLIGPNGAGKTTFFNCLLGILRPEEGAVLFDGEDITELPTYQRARRGFGRTFQRIELFTGMSVRDHLLVAARASDPNSRRFALLKDLTDWIGKWGRPTPAQYERANATLELLGLSDVADAPVESLSLGRGRLVELGRALMTEPKLLLADEPSSGLDVSETEEMVDVFEHVRDDRGTAILLVEHDVDMVRRATSRLYVLDFGTLIASGATNDVFDDEAVRRAYLGESV